MTDVLSALEHSERQTRQEVPGSDQPGRRSEAEPGGFLQETTGFYMELASITHSFPNSNNNEDTIDN